MLSASLNKKILSLSISLLKHQLARTPQRGTQYIGTESLLVFSDLGRVSGRFGGLRGRDVDVDL